MRMARYRLILKLSKKSGYRQCVAQFLLRIAFLPPPAVILSSNINLLEGRTMKRSIWCRNRFASPSNPAFFWCCVIAAALAAALFTQPAHAQQIAIEKTGFDSLPSKFFYFKNSEVYKVALLGIPGIWLNLMGFFQVVLWLDANAHILWRSEDHGKSWNQAADIPKDQADFLFEHPFDNDKVRMWNMHSCNTAAELAIWLLGLRFE